MAERHVYREVALSAVEADELREIAERLDRFGEATGDRRWHGWSGLLRLLARRFERQEPFEVSPGVTLTPNLRASDCAGWATADEATVVSLDARRRLRVLDGGGAA